MKFCPQCKENKPKSDFYSAKERSDGLRGKCKSCCNKNHNKWYQTAGRDRTRTTSTLRKSNLKMRYGITPERYEELLMLQKGLCALCGTSDPGRNHKNWCVDHCHTTNVVRGLLCHQCNVGLGVFKDNVTTLERAIQYLKAQEEVRING